MKQDPLFNGNCYGQYAILEKLANTVGSIIDHLNETKSVLNKVLLNTEG